jgi:hypothetical protein
VCHIQRNRINEINFCRVLLSKMFFLSTTEKFVKVMFTHFIFYCHIIRLKPCLKSSFLIITLIDVLYGCKMINKIYRVSLHFTYLLLKILYRIFHLVFHMPAAYSNIIRHNTCLLSDTTNSQYFFCYWS